MIGVALDWEIWIIAPIIAAILVIGLVMVVRDAMEREAKRSFLRLWHLASYFTSRFTGNSSLSIFAIIEGLFNIDNPKLWDWARGCEMSQQIFNSWVNSLISRMENGISDGRFAISMPVYLNELWLVNNHYFEMVDQFYEIADKFETPRETVDLYNKFVVEYNAFVQDFRDNISKLRRVAETAIEPPSLKFALELSVAK
jgi:hypothetical protein